MYDVQVNISKLEWLVIQELRKLQYGDLSLKVVDGLCVDLRVGRIPHSRKELEELQST